MAIRNNREEEEKAADVVVVCNYLPLYFLVFSFSPFLFFFLAILFYETRKRTDVHTHFTLCFSLRTVVYLPIFSLQMLVSGKRTLKKGRRTSAAKQMKTTSR